MYDIDRDGRLSKEDIQETLKMMVKFIEIYFEICGFFV
jgi:hypothetical protein